MNTKKVIIVLIIININLNIHVYHNVNKIHNNNYVMNIKLAKIVMEKMNINN